MRTIISNYFCLIIALLFALYSIIIKKFFFSSYHFKITCLSLLFLNSIDDKGQVVRINFNNATRDTILDIPAEKVKPFYAALKNFVNLLNRVENKYTYKMKPGE